MTKSFYFRVEGIDYNARASLQKEMYRFQIQLVHTTVNDVQWEDVTVERDKGSIATALRAMMLE